MSKLSLRLKSLTNYISLEDKVVDVGCDHGLLSIYLYENKLCKKIIASDINENALNNAKKNIAKRNLDIETVLSDGITNVNLKDIDTLIISGMGTSTIKHILNDKSKLKKIKKLVIQSNNDHSILRKYLNDIGYYLEDEIKVFDHNIWYITMVFVKSNKKNTIDEIEYGFLNNVEYEAYYLKGQKNILKKIPWTNIKQKIIKYLEIKKYLKVYNKKSK